MEPHCLTFQQDCSRNELSRWLEETVPTTILLPSKIRSLLPEQNAPKHCALIFVENPFQALLKVLPEFFQKEISDRGIHPTAVISSSATLGADVSIGAFVVVGDGCSIGDRCVLHPHVVVYPRCSVGTDTEIHAHTVLREGTIVGASCTIQSGATLGSDGFGYYPNQKGDLLPVPQVGFVTLEEGVDIGANTCIDRGTLGQTVIRRGAKLDNLVQVGHNVEIGQHSILCGQVGVAGSTRIGNRVTLGGQVGTADHISIADGVRVGGKGGVHSDITEPGDYLGNPAEPKLQYHRTFAVFKKLPSLMREMRRIARSSRF